MVASTRRVLRSVPALLSVVLVDADGAPRTTEGAVTVTAVRGNGEDLFDGARDAEPGIEPGEYTVMLTPEDTAELDRIELTWTDDSGGQYTTIAEIVGGFYFSPDEARKAAPGLDNLDLYPTALVLEIRNEVEQEVERITSRAFVPRYRRVVLETRRDVRVPDIDVRTVRRVTIDGRQYPLRADARGYLVGLSPEQVGNAGPGYGWRGSGSELVVEYEHGLDAPPADLKRAALVRFVDRIGLAKSGAPERNEYQVIDGQVFTVTQPGVRGSLTGIREVDAVYAAYSVSSDVMAVRIGAR